MFTGIIEAKGKILTARPQKGGLSVDVEKPHGWKLAEGQSVAVDGICSTVIRSDAKTFSVQYMPETLSKTTADEFQKGRTLNLERSLRLNQFVDGHLTQGHVDARVTVHGVKKKGMKHLLTIDMPKNLMCYVVLHGSIAINGVSLTVARVQGSRVTLALVPHTLAHTNLGALTKGDSANMEVDLIARYVIHGRRVLK